MAKTNSRLKSIYTVLKDAGADVGTEQEFNDYFLAPGDKGYKNRMRVWQTFNDAGADVGKNYEEFRDWLHLGSTQSPPSVKSVPPVAAKDAPDNRRGTGAKTPATRPDIGGIPAAKMPEGAMRFNSADLNNWKRTTANPEGAAAAATGTVVPDPEAQQVNDVVEALRGNEEAAKRAGFDRAMPQARDRIDYWLATGGKELTGPIEDSEILAPTVGRDAEGNVITDAGGNPTTGVTNDPARVGLQRYGHEAYKQAKHNTLSAQMERAQQELEDLDKQLETPQTELGSMFSAPLLRDEKRVALERTRKQVEERIKGLQVEMAGGEKGFWKGLTDAALDKSTWMFGLDKLADSARALRIANKMRNGEQITDEERALLEATMANQEVQQRLDDNSNFMYRAGRMTTEMVPFMIGIGVTGGMSGVSGIGVNAGRRAMAAYARKYGTDALRHRVAEGMLQGTGALVGDLMAGVAMANTVGAANTLSDILDRRIGRLEYDPEGNPVFVGGKSWGESIYQGEVGQSLEYATEMMGAHILEPRLSRLVKFAGETGGLRGAARVVKGIAGNDTYKATANWLKRIGIQDIPSEGLEEEVNMLLGIGLHADDTDEQVRQFLDSDKHKEIWGGMGLSIAFMHGFGAGAQSIGRAYNEVQYARYKTKVDDASKVAGFRLGEDRWDAWKKKIDNTQNEDMGDIYTQVLDETSMAPEEKQAVVDYMQKLTSMRGYNLGRFRATQENASAVMPDEMAAHDTYNEGVLARGGERNVVGRQAREAASALSALPDGEGIGQEIDRLVNEDESYMVVEGYLNNLSEESREAARAYYLSAIRSKGVWDNAQEEVDNRVKDFEQSLAPGVVENEDGRNVMLANVQGAPALVVSDNGDTAVIYQNGRKRQVKSGDVQDVEIYNYDEYVNSYRQQEEQKATAEVEFALNNHANTQMPSVGLALHEGEDTYQVTGINPSTGEVTATKVKLDKDGQLVPDGGAMVTLTEQEVLDLQNQYYEDLDARTAGLAAQPQQTEQPEAEQGTEEEPAIEEAPTSDVPGTVTLEEQRNAVLAIDPEAQDLLDTIEWQINDYGVVTEGFYDSVPRELEEPLREYARLYAESKNAPVEEAPAADVPGAVVDTADTTGGATTETTAMPQSTETELPRDKDGDLDIDAIRQSGDGQVMADALKAEFGDETANAVAQEYLTEAVKAQEREKNPAKKMGSKKKAVDFWREVAGKLNVSAEGGSTAKATDTERADTNGMLKAGAAATEKWAQAEKIVGAEGIYTMDDGSDITGRYVLVEEGATTPSHDPHTFGSSEGYPVNEQGQNANSRDYQNSPNAQASVVQMGNDYDGRALKDVPVVSADGIVWSGNNRTMSGMLAAENGKDGKYIESLKRQAARFGFTPEQIEGMQHPRVVFVPDEGQGLDYTPQTFNRFNAPSQKEENSVEKGVKMGKVLSDHTFNLLQQEVARFGSLANVFKSQNACREIIRIMQEAPEIVEVNQQTLPRYIGPDGLLTEEGQNLLESALVGYVFKNNPEVVSQIDKLPKRALNQLAEAMPEITANASAGEYALTGELAEAIRTLVEQQASGQSLDEYMKQMDLFRENTLVAKTTEALARALDARAGTPLKDILSQYNDRAVEAAAGQSDMFSDNSREGILKAILGIEDESPKQEEKSKQEGGKVTSHLEEGDKELYPEVKAWLDENPNATRADVQRQFKIGYNKASRMMYEWQREREQEEKSSKERLKEGLFNFLDQAGVEDLGFVERMSEDEMRELDGLINEWEKVNDEFGRVIEENNDKTTSKNAADRKAATEAIDYARLAANKAFEPVMEYVNALIEKYGEKSATEEEKPESKGDILGLAKKMEEEANAKQNEQGELDKPLSTLNEVKAFMQSIGYTSGLSNVMTNTQGQKYVKYKASGNVTPNIYFGETTKRDILRQFHLYRNVMNVNIPASVEAEFKREDAERKAVNDALYASDREEIKGILSKAGVPFFDVIDSERGSRIVFTDKKNDNGNYTDWMDVSDPDQARDDIEFIKAKAEKFGSKQEKGGKNVRTEKRDSYNAGERVILDEDGKEYTIEYITTEGEVIPGQQNTYTTYYHLDGKPYNKYTADQLSAVVPAAEATGTEAEETGAPIQAQQAETAVETAATTAEEEYGKDNKLVSRDRYEELKKRMQAKLRGQANAGFDPEILAIGTEMAMFHVEAGARTFIDFAKRMINDLGDAIRPYLKAIYNGAKDMPGMEELRKSMTSYEGVMNTDVNGIGETAVETAGTTAETAGTTAETAVVRREEDADKYRAFSQSVADDMLEAMETGEKPYKSIVAIRAKAKSVGLDIDEGGRDDILLQELVEDGLVSAARQYVNRYIISAMLRGEKADDVRKSRELFNEVVRLYSLQPTISQRSTNRIRMQQYSTPLPMSFAADMFAFRERMRDVLEPTAGNGMLVFAIPEGTVHANELDKTRLDNLRAQKFKRVTDQDAMQPFEGDQQYDAVITNPPFGNAEAKEYDGKMIPGLAPQIALNALAKMKDDGKAVIIIGGNMTYGKNGGIVGDKQFFTYLYDHYNVKGVIDMDGKLYQKQGTTYPTRMILIDGRRSEADRELSKVYPPVQSEALPKAETFDDLYRIVTEVINSNKKTNGNEVLRTAPRELESDAVNKPGKSEQRPDNRQSDTNDTEPGRGGRGGTDVEAGSQEGGRPVLGTSGQTSGTGAQRGQYGRTGRVPGQRDDVEGNNPRVVEQGADSGNRVNNDGRLVGGERSGSLEGRDLVKPKEQRKLNQEKLPYRPHSTAFSLESVAPAAMVESMDAALAEIEKEVGGIDEFVRSELGYDTVKEAHDALAAEQMDSVAMAIYQMKQGNGIIIGDQTGVGKGRQMAALIRWAVKQGKKPVFITKDANLFSDIYRDLVDIGSGDLRPFIFNDASGSNPGVMTDNNGTEVYRSPSDAVKKRIFATGKLPDDYDYAVLSYSQVNTGDAQSREEARQAAKKNGGRAKKKDTGKERPTPKVDFLRKIAKDNIMLLDESHSAAGESNTGAYLQSLVKDAKAVTFASATFAKRPDTMPLYAIRTAMSKANVKPDELIAIIEKGGVTLQEIMSRALSESGQMVRRERDMSDVKTDWTTVDDEATVKRARENYDRTIEAFNAIIQFQKQFVEPKIAELDAELGWMASSADVKKGTKNAGVDNPPFVNKAFNYTKQLLLALKVDAIVDQVEAEIKAGRHPVIALESTMESSLSDFAVGEAIEEPTFALSLLRGLDTVMQYTVKDEDGKGTHATYSPAELGPVGEKAYYALQDFIRKATQDVFISPLDAIIEKLNERGYKVGELTGRETYLGKDGEGNTVVKSRGKVDKKKLARDFNSGKLDVLILNKSASTGISLHASKKFADQRQRTMVIAQPLSDINDYMQMIGRIDRTGQVHRGYYINLGLPVPAESRFLMMLATKLKSLNANTTTSQESKSSDVEAPDLLNKYGSQVIIEYLRDNPEVYEKMGQPLGKQSEPVKSSELEEYKAKEDDASRITGRVALLSTAEQDAFYDDVVKRYNDLIKYLDETGTNDLKITALPLRAKTVLKKVSSEGVDPKGRNPFAQNAYVEEVEMDVLRKPMKADEVRKAMAQLNKPLGVEKGHMRNAYQDEQAGERVLEIVGTIEREREAKLQAEDERYDREKSKAEDSIRKRTEKINASTKASEAEKREAIETYAEEQRAKVDEGHEGRVNAINNQAQNLTNRLGWFAPGQTYLVPDNLDTDVYMFTSPAIFCGYKAKESKVTPSTTFAVFATLDGRRRIEVKMSQIGPLTHIKGATDNNFDTARRTNLDNWDSQLPTNTRKKGYIMTGNILQAVADTQDQNGNYPGQLISFTDENGEIRDGILMPDKWEPGQLKTAGAPILSRIEQIKNLTWRDKPIVSTDGKVQIIRERWGDYFVRVPKSKKEGGKYYLNDDLLKYVGYGGFHTKAGMMQGDVPKYNIEDVVKLLSKMGVRVSSEDEMGEDESTDEKGEEGGVHFHIVSDPFKIAELEMGPKIRVYRAMQLIDGKLYPPMSAKTDGKLRKPIELGMWEEAEERPEMADSKGFFTLNKGNGKSLKARYNPYFHTSRSPLNDQFTSAYDRPNLVTTEVEVPESELTSGYKAEKAKDAVGEMTWHAGPVSGKLPEGKKRKVILSRWDKPIRIVPDSEVASKIAELLEGENIPIPYNTITPSLRAELEKRGVKVSGEAKGNVRQDGGVKFNVVEPIPPFDMSKLDTRDVASLMSAINEQNNTERAKTRIAPLVEEVASEMEGAYGVIISTGPSFLRDLAEDERLTKKERQDLLGIASGALAPNAGYIESIDKIIIFNLDANKKEIKSYLCHETTHRAIRNMGLKGSVASWYEALEKLAPQRFAEIRANYAGINRNEQTQKEECVVDFVERTVSELGIEGARAYFSGLSQRDFNAYGLTHIVDYIKQGENDRRRIPAKESRDRVGQEEVRRGHADATGNGAGIDGNRSDGTNLHVEARPGLSDEERGRGDRERGYTPVTSRKENGRSAEDSQRDRQDDVRSGRRRGDAVRSISEKGREGVSFSISSVRHNAGLAQAEYDATVSGFAHRMRETWQDSMLSLKRLQDAVLKETGGRLLDSQNAWMAENRLSSSNKAQQEEFIRIQMAALIDAVAALGGADERQYERIKKYMIAKHGLERNIVFAERDAREAAGADSGPEYDSFLEKFRKRDYSGLTGLFGVDDVEDAEDMAHDYVDRFEDGQDEEIDDLWAAVRGVSGFALQKSLDSGMISQETYDTLRAQFAYYIPLRGWDETTSDEVYDYIGRQVAGVQDIMKHAKGRKSVADDPLATLQDLAMNAITIGNRNMVKQHFLNLANMHKSNLISVSPLWMEYENSSGSWVAKFPKDIYDNDSPEEVARKTEAFNQQMESLAQFDPDHVKRVREKDKIPYLVAPGSLSSHQVLVKQGGRTHVLTVNGDPRAAEAVNGLTNPNTAHVYETLAAASRWIAMWSTARRISFIAKNLWRDMHYSIEMAFLKEGGKYGAKFMANWAALSVKMPILLRKLSNGTLDRTDPNSIEGMFYDFVHNGGETGYTIRTDVDEAKRYIQQRLNPNYGRSIIDFIGGVFDFMGRWSEGISRFAAYKTSIEMGRSRARAIYDAKDISTNFSKKGAGAAVNKGKSFWDVKGVKGKFIYAMASMNQFARSAFAFFNASIQGLENIARASYHHPARATNLFLRLGALGYSQAAFTEFIMNVLGEGGDGDDDDKKNPYYDLPWWRRSGFINIYLSGGHFLSLPLAPEFAVPFGLGALLAEYMDPKEVMSEKDFKLRFAQQIGSALPIDPTSNESILDWKGFVPTGISPVTGVFANENWMGLPIMKETDYNKKDPEYKRVYRNTGAGYIEISKWISEATGGNPHKRGNVEINPAQVEYLCRQYLSGFYHWISVPNKVVRYATGKDDEFDWKSVGVIYAFHAEADQRAVEERIDNQFFDLKDEMDGIKHERDGWAGDVKAAMNDTLEYAKAKETLEKYEKSRAYTEYMIWHMGDKQLQKIREQGKEGEDVEENEYMLKQQMIDAIRTYRKTGDENKAIDVYPQKTIDKADRKEDEETEEEATT